MENSFYHYEPETDREGNERMGIYIKYPILEKIRWFNDTFNVIGLWLKEDGVPVTNTLFNAEANINFAWNLNSDDIMSNRHNVMDFRKNDAINLFYYIFENDTFPLSSSGNVVQRIQVHFNYEGLDTSAYDSYNNYSLGNDGKCELPTFNVKIKEDSEERFIEIVIEKIRDYILNHLSTNIYGKGIGTVEFPAIYNILNRGMVLDMDEEKLCKIVYEELSNSKNSHVIFTKFKGTRYNAIFKRIGGDNYDNAIDMVGVGYSDD
jgi:hypothetical protein